MLHTQTTRTGEVEAERSEVQGHFSATKQVQDQPGYIRHRLKQIKEKSTCGILQSVAKASYRLFYVYFYLVLVMLTYTCFQNNKSFSLSRGILGVFS